MTQPPSVPRNWNNTTRCAARAKGTPESVIKVGSQVLNE